MRIDLLAVSPFAFEVSKPERRVLIRKKSANKNEYRDKIGVARDCFLVLIGPTKIGMIPEKYVAEIELLPAGTKWKIVALDREINLVTIEDFIPSLLV